MNADETPRSLSDTGYFTPRDDRFYTPRAMINSSGDEWQTPRNGNISDADFETPRGISHKEEQKHYIVADPHKYWNNVAKSNIASAKEEYDNEGDDAIALGIMEGVSDQDVEDIFSYARHGRCEDIERLLDRGIPINVRDTYGNTILTTACQNGNKRVAKLALRRGADINARNHKGNTPLHYCYHYGYGDSLGEYIISKGADAHCKNNYGRRPNEGI